MDAIGLCKALSDSTRLRCVALLAGHDELCVCELTHALGLPQPKVSHHLGALRKAGLVSDRKEGLWIYYRIKDELPSWATKAIEAAVEGALSDPAFVVDVEALRTMPNRPGGICSA